ncbi:unnamed protein product [Musa hybrid cultivar]
MGAKIACVILLLILFAADVVVEAQQPDRICKVVLDSPCTDSNCAEGCTRTYTGDGVCENNRCICSFQCPL